MQQENDRRIIRPSFSVEDGEPINLHCAIEDLLFHCFLLCLGICGGYVCKHQYQHCNAGADSTCRFRGVHKSSNLPCHFKDHFELNWHPQGQTGNPDHQPNRHFVGTEDISKKVRCSIRNPRLVEKLSRCRHEHAQSNHARHAIERSQMFLSRCQCAQSRRAYRIPPRLDIHFLPQPAKILRLVIHNREHAAEEKQIPCLQCLDVTTERRRGSRKLNAKFQKPALRAARLRTSDGYHRPTCAPSSTCSTSPVT